MGLLKKVAFKNILKRVGLGVMDNVPVLATIKDNMQSEDGGKGKLDYLRLSVSACVFVLVLAVIFGAIDVETLKAVINAIK